MRSRSKPRGWLFFFAALLTPLGSASLATAQWVPFTAPAGTVVNSTGQAFTGIMNICPVDTQGNPLSYAVTGGNAGTAACAPVQVTAGAFNTVVPDTLLTFPKNLCLSLSAQDPVAFTEDLPGRNCVQPSIQANSAAVRSGFCTVGAGCNFGNYHGGNPALPVTPGPIGPPGQPGCIAGSSGCTTAVALAASGNQNVQQAVGTQLTLNGSGVCQASGVNCRPGGSATLVGASADGTVTADNGSAERFYADFHPDGSTNPDGSTHVPGWDAEQNVAVSAGHIGPKVNGTAMWLTRGLIWGSAGSLTAQATMFWGANSNTQNIGSCIGFNNNAPGVTTSSASQRFAVCLGADSAQLLNGTDSPRPLYFPSSNTFITVSLWAIQDTVKPGTWDVSVSMLPIGTNGAVTNYFPQITLLSGIGNFEISGGSSANDLQYNVRYAVGGNGGLQHVNFPADDAHFGLASVLTSDTLGTSPGFGSIFALIPPTYRIGKPNKAVLYMHGLNEAGFSVSCAAPYAGCNQGVSEVALALMNAGYVVIGIGAGGTTGPDSECYGNSTCQSELAQVVQEYSAKLSLAPGFYGFAESMGGFELLNAISQGTVPIRAYAGCCLNTNLADDYFTTYTPPGSTTAATEAGSAGPAAPATYGAPDFIDPAYHISGTNLYAAATLGFDPQVAAQSTGTVAQSNLISVPGMIWASYGDTAVNRSANSDLFASTLNAAAGRTVVQVMTCTGNHEDLSCFQPAAVVSFFNAH